MLVHQQLHKSSDGLNVPSAVVSCGILIVGCASHVPMKKKIPGAEERAYLLANVEPTLVHERSPTESWEVWVLRDDRGEYRTRVCVSYGPTGSRIRRNTCRGVDTARIKIFKFGPNQYNVVASKATDEAWDVILGEDLEVAMSDVLNTEVKIIDLDNDPEH
ncbi:MAG: hypothetical protein AAFQ82_08955 [Myxococcota bacterium]